MNPCSHANTKPGTLFLLGDTWRTSYRCLDCGQTGEGFGPPGPDLWGAPRALRERPPCSLSSAEMKKFAIYWSAAVSVYPDFFWMEAAIDAFNVLFPGEPKAGYFRPVTVALADRATPEQAMRALWSYPKPDVIAPAQEPAEVRP